MRFSWAVDADGAGRLPAPAMAETAAPSNSVPLSATNGNEAMDRLVPVLGQLVQLALGARASAGDADHRQRAGSRNRWHRVGGSLSLGWPLEPGVSCRRHASHDISRIRLSMRRLVLGGTIDLHAGVPAMARQADDPGQPQAHRAIRRLSKVRRSRRQSCRFSVLMRSARPPASSAKAVMNTSCLSPSLPSRSSIA